MANLSEICLQFTFAGPVAAVSAPDDPFARLLPILLEGYTPVAAESSINVRIEIMPDATADGWLVTTANWPPFRETTAKMAARRAEWLLVKVALSQVPHLLHVHAGALSSAKRTFLLVGQSGSGKSTTSVALAQIGYTLYSDDVTLIDRATLRPVSVPRPIRLDDVARQLLADDGLIISPEYRIDNVVCRAALPGRPVPNVQGPLIDTVIFFAGQRHGRPRLRQLTQAEASFRLMRQSTSELLEKGMPSESAIELISRSRCYELEPGPLGDTVSAITSVVDVA